ncbi:MAG: hypothetical protein AAF394_13100 [Planctomycetota bacterium]
MTASEESSSTPPSAISGPKLTFIVIVLLIVLGGLISYTLSSYNAIDVARAKATAAWQELAEELSSHYRQVEFDVATRVDAREVAMEDGEEFRLALDAFRGTSILEKQFAATERVQESLGKMKLEPAMNSSLQQKLADYNSEAAATRELIQSSAGQVLAVFLNFPQYAELQLK